jgi:hypothetical protein
VPRSARRFHETASLGTVYKPTTSDKCAICEIKFRCLEEESKKIALKLMTSAQRQQYKQEQRQTLARREAQNDSLMMQQYGAGLLLLLPEVRLIT